MQKIFNPRTLYATFAFCSIIVTCLFATSHFIELPGVQNFAVILILWFVVHSFGAIVAIGFAFAHRLGLIFKVAPIAFVICWSGWLLFTPLVPAAKDNGPDMILILASVLIVVSNLMLLVRTITTPVDKVPRAKSTLVRTDS